MYAGYAIVWPMLIGVMPFIFLRRGADAWEFWKPKRLCQPHFCRNLHDFARNLAERDIWQSTYCPYMGRLDPFNASAIV